MDKTIFVGGLIEEAKYHARQYAVLNKLLRVPTVVAMYTLSQWIRQNEPCKIIFCGTYPENRNFLLARNEAVERGFTVEYQ